MKKYMLTFGLISGAASAAMLLATVPFMEQDRLRQRRDLWLHRARRSLPVRLLRHQGVPRRGTGRDDHVRPGPGGRPADDGDLEPPAMSRRGRWPSSTSTPDFFDKYSAYTTARARAARRVGRGDRGKRRGRWLSSRRCTNNPAHQRRDHVHRAAAGGPPDDAGVGDGAEAEGRCVSGSESRGGGSRRGAGPRRSWL